MTREGTRLKMETKSKSPGQLCFLRIRDNLGLGTQGEEYRYGATISRMPLVFVRRKRRNRDRLSSRGFSAHLAAPIVRPNVLERILKYHDETSKASSKLPSEVSLRMIPRNSYMLQKVPSPSCGLIIYFLFGGVIVSHPLKNDTGHAKP